MAVDSVVFGPDDTAMTTSNNRLWSGVMTYEPATVTVNMAKQEAVNITLAKTELRRRLERQPQRMSHYMI